MDLFVIIKLKYSINHNTSWSLATSSHPSLPKPSLQASWRFKTSHPFKRVGGSKQVGDLQQVGYLRYADSTRFTFFSH